MSIIAYANESLVQSPSPQYHSDNGNLNFRGPSIALRFTKEKIINEFELRFHANSINKSTDDDYSRQYIHLSYERGKTVKFRLFNAIEIQPAIGFTAFYFNEEVDLYLEQHQQRKNLIATKLTFITHLNYSLSEKLYLNLNFEVIDLQVGLLNSESDNINVPIEDRTGTLVDFDANIFPLLSFGVGYNF